MRMRNSALLHGFWLTLASAFVLPGEALAGWGDDNWGALMWNEIVSPPLLPTLGIVGLTLLAMGLAATAAWTLRKRRPALGVTLALVLLAIPLAVAAGTLTVPNTFVNGTMADADQVNANFDAVETEVNDNDARITANTAAASANTTIISENGPYTLPGTDNTAVGMDALAYDGTGAFGNYLTAFGSGALESNITGVSNTAVGWDSLNDNTNGNYNTAVGQEALQSNLGDFFNSDPEQGSRNTAVGYQAQKGNVSGRDNTAVGAQAGGCQHASYNTALGTGTLGGCAMALFGEERAWYNTAVGAYSLSGSQIDGSYNTAVGAYSLTSSLGGSNTAVGAFALENTHSSGNTAVGYGALNSHIDGGANVAIGDEALGNLVIGGFNIAIGRNAGSALVGPTYPLQVNDNILIGNDGVSGESDTIRIGRPGTHLNAHIAGALHVGNIRLDGTAVTSGYGVNLVQDDEGIKLGHTSSIRDIQFQTDSTTRMTIEADGIVKLDHSSASYDVWIQGGSSTSSGDARNLAILGQENTDTLVLNYGSEYTNGTEVQSDLNVTSGNNLNVLGGEGRFTGLGGAGISATGSLMGGSFEDTDTGIYAWAGIAAYSIWGNGLIRGVGAYQNGSDLRLKKNISDIDNPLATLLALRGVEFEWRNENLGGGKKFGFIAQEAEEVVPQVVIPPMEFGDPAEKDGVGEYYAMEYGTLTALLTEAVKELKAEKDVEIAALEKDKAEKDVEIAALKQRLALVEQLSARLAKLEAQVRADAQVVQASNGTAGG